MPLPDLLQLLGWPWASQPRTRPYNKISAALLGNTGSIVHANMGLNQLYVMIHK